MGSATAWIAVEPGPTLVMGTLTLLRPVGTWMMAGTVAIVGSSDVRVTTRPLAGAAVGIVKVSVWVVPIPVMVTADGEKPGVFVTNTA